MHGALIRLSGATGLASSRCSWNRPAACPRFSAAAASWVGVPPPPFKRTGAGRCARKRPRLGFTASLPSAAPPLPDGLGTHRALRVRGAPRRHHDYAHVSKAQDRRHSRGRTGGRHTHRPRARSIRRRPPPLIRLKRCGRRGSSPRCSRAGAHWRERSGPQRRNAR
jgi:hypothetical protein